MDSGEPHLSHFCFGLAIAWDDEARLQRPVSFVEREGLVHELYG